MHDTLLPEIFGQCIRILRLSWSCLWGGVDIRQAVATGRSGVDQTCHLMVAGCLQNGHCTRDIGVVVEARHFDGGHDIRQTREVE